MNAPLPSSSWIVHGSGAVAAVVSDILFERGMPFAVAGRTGPGVERLAARYGVPALTVASASTQGIVQGIAGLIDTAGPFGNASRALMAASAAVGTHYVSVSNEPEAFRAAGALNDAAVQSGAAIVVGAGMGTLFSERLTASLSETVPGATSALVVTLPSGTGHKTVGVGASESRVLAAPPAVVRGGHARQHAGRVVKLPRWMEVRSGIVLDVGDLYAVRRTSHLPDVTLAAGVDVPHRLLRVLVPFRALKARHGHHRHRPGPSSSVAPWDPGARAVRLLAEVTGTNGTVRRGRLHARSGTVVAGHVAVEALTALTAGDRSGVLSAFEVLGDSPLPAGLEPQIELL